MEYVLKTSEHGPAISVAPKCTLLAGVPASEEARTATPLDGTVYIGF
jgi:hypothetical protein